MQITPKPNHQKMNSPLRFFVSFCKIRVHPVPSVIKILLSVPAPFSRIWRISRFIPVPVRRWISLVRPKVFDVRRFVFQLATFNHSNNASTQQFFASVRRNSFENSVGFENEGLFRYDLEILREIVFFILFCALFMVVQATAARTKLLFRSCMAGGRWPAGQSCGGPGTDGGRISMVATQAGVVLFDGARFQRVSRAGSPESIAGTMRAMMLDRSGRVWLAKEEGGTLFCFKGAQVRMVTGEQGLPKNETQSSMAVDGQGDLWVGYSTGKVIRYSEAGKVEAFTSKPDLPKGDNICWLASGRDECCGCQDAA